MIRDIPICLHGKNEILTVEYQENTSPTTSGFDALAVDTAASSRSLKGSRITATK